MADQRTAHSGEGDNDVARLAALAKRQNEIWDLLRDAKDEQARNDLLDELTANREEQARLKGGTTGSTTLSPTPRPSRPATPSSGPIPQASDAEGPRSVGEQLRSQIMGPGPGVAPPKPPPPPPPAPPPPVVVEEVDVRVDLVPSAGTTSPPGDDDRGSRAEPPVIRPTSAAQVDPEPQRSHPAREVGAPIGAEASEMPAAPAGTEHPGHPDAEDESPSLLPEAMPYRTREDDLAATRTRRDSQPRDGELVATGAGRDTKRYSRSASAPVRHTAEVLEELRQSAHKTYEDIGRVRPALRSQPRGRLHQVLAILVALAAVAAAVWFLFLYDRGGVGRPPESTTTTISASTEEVAPAISEQIQEAVDALGRGAVTVEESNGVVYLMGGVPTEADRQAVIGTAESLAAGSSVNSSALSVFYHDDELRIAVLNALSATGFDRLNVSVRDGLVTVGGVTPDPEIGDLATTILAVDGVNAVMDATEEADRAPALGLQLERLSTVSPIEFGEGQSGLASSQKVVLDEAADLIDAYPGPMVTIVAYGDDATVATGWAEQARDHLVSSGVPSDRLAVSAATPGAEQGLAAVQRLEFEPGYALAARGTPDFVIGIVAEGTRSDFALTHSIVDAAMAMAMERTDLGVDITDGMGTVGEAEIAIRNYARDRYDLIIVEGSDLGPTVAALAADYPEVAFAMADSSDTYNLPNVSAMRVAADEGGYVLGVLSAQMSSSGVLGAVGTVDAGTDARYFAGFTAGVLSINSETTVLTAYTQSTDDLSVAEARVGEQIAAGADVVTGSSGVSVTGVGVADSAGALWFGNQADQALLNPDTVVASQVYRWEVGLRRIISGIDQGSLGGQAYELNLSNGGLAIAYSPGYTLDDALRVSTDYVVSGLATGSISTGI